MQLLLAFDIQKWLQDSDVDVNARLELLRLVSHGISQLGSSPSFQDYPLFETYAQHIRCILSYRYPVHLIDVLRTLLTLSDRGLFPVNGWISCFFSVLDIPVRDLSTIDAKNLDDVSEAVFRCATNGKTSAEIASIVIADLTQFFWEVRKRSDNGLYVAWSPYTGAMAVLFLTFCGILTDLRKSDDVFAKV